MTPFKWIKMFIYPHQGDFDFSKHWLQAVCIFFNKWKYGVNNGFRWWKFFIILYIEYKQFPLQLSSLPFLPPASKFIFDCQKEKKKKREEWVL